MLDEFQKPAQPKPAQHQHQHQHQQQQQQQQAPANSELPQGDEDPLSDEFVAELAKNMESFMSQIRSEAPPPPAPSGGAEESSGPGEDELMHQFAKLLSDTAPADSSHKEPSSTPAGNNSFQDVIQATMDKLKQSDQSSGAADGKDLGLGGDNDLSQLLAALGSGENGQMPDLTKMLTSMMEDLMSKDVLYEPIKDMHKRFPGYLASEKGTALSDEVRARYQKQHGIMAEIIEAYESPNYDDNNPESRKKVSELVTRLQDLGSPPEELLGEMPPELASMNSMIESGDENCSIM